MESKISKSYLIKWYELILQGASADIECDIEEIEEKSVKKTSLFFTGKLLRDEMVIKNSLLNDIKRAVQTPYEKAKDNYEFVMRSHGYDLELLKEELNKLKIEKENHSKQTEPNSVINEINVVEKRTDQLALF